MKWSSGSCRPAVGRRVQTSAVGCARQSGAVGCARQSGAAARRVGAEAWRGGGGGRDFGCSPYTNHPRLHGKTLFFTFFWVVGKYLYACMK